MGIELNHGGNIGVTVRNPITSHITEADFPGWLIRTCLVFHVYFRYVVVHSTVPTANSTGSNGGIRPP